MIVTWIIIGIAIGFGLALYMLDRLIDEMNLTLDEAKKDLKEALIAVKEARELLSGP